MKATLGKLKGKDLRPTQETAVTFVRNSKRRFISVRGPTGIGKTCLGFESMDRPFYYMCNSIPLQEQALRDYPEARLLMGRGNYECEKYGTADLCLENKACVDCAYDIAKMEGLAAQMTILNFHYFLSIANYTEKGIPSRNIIIDEADSMEQVLADFISFDFTLKRMNEVMDCDIPPPDKKTKLGAVKTWMVMRNSEVIKELGYLKPKLKWIKSNAGRRDMTYAEKKLLKKYQLLRSLLWKLGFLIEENLEENWIYRYSEERQHVQLKPKWLTRALADRFFFNYGLKFLFMSATIPSKEVFCGLFQIEAEEMDYIDLPNVWDSDKRKIYYQPSYNLSYKSKNEEMYNKVRNAVKEILEKEKGRGIIHSVSYELTKMMEKVSDRIIVHGKNDRKDKFEEFMNIEGAVWVSPSSTRGLDLPYDLCEFVIWLKAPFLHLNDPQVNARLFGSGKFGKTWYASDAIQTIVQGSGRGFRNEDDYCTVYLLDEQIGRLLGDNKKLIPMWYNDLVIY